MKLFHKEDYELNNNIIKRINDFEVRPREKKELLKETIMYFCGECEDQTLPKLNEFSFVEMFECNTNCICSQRIKNLYRITHNPTGLSFNIGKVCFENLYGKKQLDDLNFFKPYCKNCEREKVKSQRNHYEKEGFCSLKCRNYYNKKSFCINCDKKFWKIKPNHKLCKNCWKTEFYGTIEKVAKYSL